MQNFRYHTYISVKKLFFLPLDNQNLPRINSTEIYSLQANKYHPNKELTPFAVTINGTDGSFLSFP